MMSYLFRMKPAGLAFLATALISSAAVAAESTNAVSATVSTNAVPAVATNAAPVASTNVAAGTPSRGSDRSSRSQSAASAASASNFEAFSMIGTKNIFNQSRYPGSKPPTGPTAAPHVPKIDMISFVGTMDYGKGQMAFFNGTGSEFKKMAKAGEKIGNFKLVDVKPNQVKLAVGDKPEMELKIGQALRSEDGGDWALSSLPLPGSEPVASSSSSSGSDRGSGRGSSSDRGSGSDRSFGRSNSRSGSETTPTPAAGAISTPEAPASGGSAEDALKRLMEKRAKETNE